MKKIGRGWQYTVYDIGNGRVRKLFNTKTQAYTVFLLECFPYTDYPLWKFPTYHKELRAKAVHSINWVRTSAIDKRLFGNPTLLNETDYEQDNVTQLGQYLHSVSEQKGREILDSFVAFNALLLQNGVIDKSFLIGKNYGINADGQVILIDIGELFTDPEAIRAQVALQPWDHSYVTDTIPTYLRTYFVETMNARFA